MKTAISIPDPIFEAAEMMANRLGMSRSELFTTAMKEYMKFHQYEDVTESLNRIYQKTEDSVNEQLRTMQSNSIQREEW
jgi:metal-responsive CopG/Arc/MetJ family transcriptional regulator